MQMQTPLHIFLYHSYDLDPARFQCIDDVTDCFRGCQCHAPIYRPITGATLFTSPCVYRYYSPKYIIKMESALAESCCWSHSLLCLCAISETHFVQMRFAQWPATRWKYTATGRGTVRSRLAD